MKKCLTIAIVVLMILSFAACYAGNEVDADVDKPLLLEEVTSSTASEVPTSAPTETSTAAEPTTAVTTTEAVTATIPTTTSSAVTTTAQPKPSISASTKAKPTVVVKATATTIRVSTTRKAVTTTAKPATTAPPFDVEYWVQYAKDFALSIGMELRSNLVKYINRTDHWLVVSLPIPKPQCNLLFYSRLCGLLYHVRYT